jgi:hypothetical protein
MKLVPVYSIFNERFIMNTKSVADILGSAVDAFDSRIADVKRDKSLLKSAKVQKRVTQLVAPLLYILNGLGNVRVEIMFGKPAVYVSMFSIESFKQTELVSALAYLTDLTEKVNGKITTEDWAAAVNRDFRFETEEWRVCVHAYVKDDSPTCRKIAVGTELIERTKYEIVCD